MRKLAVLFFTVEKVWVKYAYTFWGRLKAFCWGIYLDNNVFFLGPIVLFRHGKSSISIGRNTTFNSSNLYNFRGMNHPCILQTGAPKANISIGNNCGFSSVSIVANSSVIIKDNVLCGANVSIGDRDGHSNKYLTPLKPIIINSNVWIGMNSVILKGVEIGEGTVVGANSVVTKSLPSNVIAAGNPCIIIKRKE